MSTTVFVCTMGRTGEVPTWSQWSFPFHVDAWCQMGDKLYIRAGDDVLVLDESAGQDFQGDARAQAFDGVLQWPHLDWGGPGTTKCLKGLDIATLGAVNIALEVGYDQTDMDAFTDPYTISGDTMPGTFIPFPVMACSFAVRLTFSSLDFWKFQSLTLYLSDMRVSS